MQATALPPLCLCSVLKAQRISRFRIVGVDYGEDPPVPIPNTEVKLTCADDTWLVTARENRFSPTHSKSRGFTPAFAFVPFSK